MAPQRTGVNLLFRGALSRNMDILAAVAFVIVVAIIIVPVPKEVLDILLTLNITFSLIILLTTLFISDTRHLSIFPSLLLTATLFRLALNISSTRLILTNADAGKVIDAFGKIVVGNNFVVGLVIFVIITVVQFVVITNGAGRIAEVAARFTLDALPGKQMSIDADLNSGLIDEDTARARRKELQKEADFYGAMDGASKFVRGDAIAGIVIVLINILGGLAIGVLQRGMSFDQATQVYTILTVGDGLVAQIPALMVSVAAGMLVTRSTAEAPFGEEFSRQMTAFPRVIFITAVLLFILGLVPGIPAFPFFILAAACGLLSYSLIREERQKVQLEAERTRAEVSRVQEPEDFRSLVKVELLEIEIGYNLVPLTDPGEGGSLLERITAARRRAVNELGIIVQPIRIRDNLQLSPNEYVIKMKGNEIARGDLRPGYFLALNPEGEPPAELEGIPTREPTFGLPALWIKAEDKEKAEMLNCTVVDAATVLITHLTEVIKSNAHELLGRQTVKDLLDMVKENHPAVVEELVPDILSVGDIQKVLQNLLKESIPVHDLVTILETLADHGRLTKDHVLLTESVRQSLSRTITNLYTGGSGELKVITIDPALEKAIVDSLQNTSSGPLPVLEPQKTQSIVEGVARLVEKLRARGISPVLLTSPQVRFPVRRLLERYLPQVAVVSISEILPEIRVEAVGVITDHEN